MFERMIKSEVSLALELAESYYGTPMPTPIIKFSNRMTRSGGTCKARRNSPVSPWEYTLTFSLEVMHRNNISEFIGQVVYHEVAHMVQHIVYNDLDHGKTFKFIMLEVFNRTHKQSSRTHSFEVGPKRKPKVYVYKCTTCGEIFNLKSGRHSKAQSGKASYRHAVGHPIKFIGEQI